MAAPSTSAGPGTSRVPDLAYFRDREDRVWNPTAAIVVEVVSPGDESRRKLDFYYGARVDEVLIVDPDTRSVEWFGRGPGAFEPADGSHLLGIMTAELSASIDWPS